MARDPGRVITRADFCSIFAKAWMEGMTSGNIIAGFKATGVYPPNRYAVHVPEDDMKSPVATSDAIEFLPMFTPSQRRSANVSLEGTQSISPVFTADQLKKFQKRFKEGYNLTADPVYNMWLKKYHPENG